MVADRGRRDARGLSRPTVLDRTDDAEIALGLAADACLSLVVEGPTQGADIQVDRADRRATHARRLPDDHMVKDTRPSGADVFA